MENYSINYIYEDLYVLKGQLIVIAFNYKQFFVYAMARF